MILSVIYTVLKAINLDVCLSHESNTVLKYTIYILTYNKKEHRHEITISCLFIDETKTSLYT